MTNSNEFKLMSHLMRRAGFSSTKEDIEKRLKIGYEETVEELLNPVHKNDTIDDSLLRRYNPDQGTSHDSTGAGSYWLYRLVSTNTPLQEKIGLFWHNIFATGYSKVTNGKSLTDQIAMFRKHGTGRLDDLLLELSKDPAMILWLDNMDNHKEAINENYGRELLELFSMGVGNYTEDDIKSAARAFTGWTYDTPVALYPFGHFDVKYRFRADDHDGGQKTFLGHTGNLDGEDIINIIAKQEVTARFIGRHLYNFFVADEAQVPAWSIEPPADPSAIDDLAKVWIDSDADMKVVMRTLFNSEWFKAARFKHVKSPTEFVASVLKLSGEYAEPAPDLHKLEETIVTMGQKLMDPPSVEGWHTGKEWIDGGTLTERVNYAIDTLNNPDKPGVKAIIERIRSQGNLTKPEQLVDDILDLIGPLEVETGTRDTLVAHARVDGALDWSSGTSAEISIVRVVQMLTLVVSAREFQFS